MIRKAGVLAAVFSAALLVPCVLAGDGALTRLELSDIRYIGSLQRGDEGPVFGIVQTVANELHRVRLGDRLGRDQGRVTEIRHGYIKLEERVRECVDASGRWHRRVNYLPLQDEDSPYRTVVRKVSAYPAGGKPRGRCLLNKAR